MRKRTIIIEQNGNDIFKSYVLCPKCFNIKKMDEICSCEELELDKGIEKVDKLISSLKRHKETMIYYNNKNKKGD